jgi:TldD protein
MSYTRRTMLRQSARALAVGTFLQSDSLSPLIPIPYLSPRSLLPILDEVQRQLIQTAVDAAMRAGATYADARLTFTQELIATRNIPDRSEVIAFGVRALVNGYWGFASSPVWNNDEAARLGTTAAAQARANVLGRPREVELAPLEHPQSGSWVMPVKDDPFTMAYEEIWDFVSGLKSFIGRLKDIKFSNVGLRFIRQDKSFGSSLGQYTTQRLYQTSGGVTFSVEDIEGRTAGTVLDYLTPAGLGFEYAREQPLRDAIVRAHEELLRELTLPKIPVDVGRYPTLINPVGMASIMSESIGAATQVDRAFGYEANAGGTSYITDPTTMLGTLKVGNSLVTITGNRARPGSVGRVQWDDEGVKPSEFTLIREGILTNMQTSREGAGWIKAHYTASGQPFRSFGCVSAPTAIDPPLIHSADLTLAPGSNATDTLETLRSSLDQGVEFVWPHVTFDSQQATGFGLGKAYQIKGGKRVALLSGTGMIFRTPELWNNVVMLGGSQSVRHFGLQLTKGEPAQESFHEVATPPVLIKDMNIIDITRKA